MGKVNSNATPSSRKPRLRKARPSAANPVATDTGMAHAPDPCPASVPFPEGYALDNGGNTLVHPAPAQPAQPVAPPAPVEPVREAPDVPLSAAAARLARVRAAAREVLHANALSVAAAVAGVDRYGYKAHSVCSGINAALDKLSADGTPVAPSAMAALSGASASLVQNHMRSLRQKGLVRNVQGAGWLPTCSGLDGNGQPVQPQPCPDTPGAWRVGVWTFPPTSVMAKALAAHAAAQSTK